MYRTCASRWFLVSVRLGTPVRTTPGTHPSTHKHTHAIPHGSGSRRTPRNAHGQRTCRSLTPSVSPSPPRRPWRRETAQLCRAAIIARPLALVKADTALSTRAAWAADGTREARQGVGTMRSIVRGVRHIPGGCRGSRMAATNGWCATYPTARTTTVRR